MAKAVLRLKRGREQRARVHPWIFKADVADVGHVEPGGAVTIVDAGGRFVGRGFYNPGPALCCRVVTWSDEPIDAELFRRRVQAAVARRAGAGPIPALGRLVWSEADGLPGLVADRYESTIVIQCLTLGMARARGEAVEALRVGLGDLPVFSADEATPARLEGFEPMRAWYDRAGPERVVVAEDSVKLGVTFGAGHKTGLYLDQRENRARVGGLGARRDVLDAFCYTGGFACHALAAGARRAVCVESSPEAVTGAVDNIALNGAADRATVVAANAFDELRRLERARARFGLIVVDPPPFARSRSALPAAARGYKEINLRAMRLLEPGGILATFSCSYHVSDAFFEETCQEAAMDAGVRLRRLSTLTQSADHPALLTVPESRYLKGLLLEAV